MSNVNFEINPLNINLAKMQFNMLKKLESFINDTDILKEEYKNTNTNYDISYLELVFKKLNNKTAVLEFICHNSQNNKSNSKILTTGTIEQIIQYLKGTTYFSMCTYIINKKF